MTNPPPRYASPDRRQLRMLTQDLDSLIAADHPARLIWAYVQGLDLAPFHENVKAVEGHAGRPALDPALLLALWLYATTQGVGSARALAELCVVHDAYKWLCGGLTPNYHTLADFRSRRASELDQVLVSSIAALMHEGLVTLETVAVDGVKVRAHAGTKSFRREARLRDFAKAAEEQVAALRRELDADPGASSRRVEAARERAARERQERVERALVKAKEHGARRIAASGHKSREDQEKMRRKVAKGDVRASTTDPDAHIMRMSDWGFRPAYNIQVSADAKHGFVVGVVSTNEPLDGDQLPKMIEHLHKRHGKRPTRALADGGYVTHKSISAVEEVGVRVYAPLDKPARTTTAPRKRVEKWPGVAEWRARMSTDEGAAIYAKRAPLAEFVFAGMRNRGLRQCPVRGLQRTQSLGLLHALTHNMMRDFTIRASKR